MGVFPEEVAEVSNIQHFKGYSILPLILYPAQYDSKALYWNRKIEIEIEIEIEIKATVLLNTFLAMK